MTVVPVRQVATGFVRLFHFREVEHEAWFIELLSMECDKTVRPSGHSRRGEPGDAPYSKNRGFYNP